MPVQTFSTCESPSGATNWQVARRLVGAFAPHAQVVPDMSVQLDAGHLLNGTVLTEVLTQTVGPFALPLVKRVDRIVIDRGTGAASVVSGTEGSMAPAAIPVGCFPIARVRLFGDMIAIGNEQIDDERVLCDLATAASVPPASETVPGVAELATQAEVDAGSDDARIVTPLKAASRYATKAAANETAAGLAEIATQSEVDAGVDDQRFLTPLKAGTRYATKASATEATAGLAEIATQAEVDAGSDDQRFLTPLKAATRYATKTVATETVAGLAEVATQAEVDAGTDDSRFVTPLKAATRYASKAMATTSAAGLAQIATQAEVNTGTDDSKIVTPLTAATQYATKALAGESAPGLAEIATQAEVDAGTDDQRFLTPLKAATRYAPKVAPVLTSVAESVQTAASTGAAYTIGNCQSSGTVVPLTLTANTTITLPDAANRSEVAGTAFALIVKLTQDATGGRSVTWAVPAGESIAWDQSASAPAIQAMASKVTSFVFLKIAGDPVWRGNRFFKEA